MTALYVCRNCSFCKWSKTHYEAYEHAKAFNHEVEYYVTTTSYDLVHVDTITKRTRLPTERISQ